MPESRDVCLSDLHLGADNSVLSRIQPGRVEVDPSQPSLVLSLMVARLRQLLEQHTSERKPTRVLNGDMLELALSDTNQAAVVKKGTSR
jgi:hypothetical protein